MDMAFNMPLFMMMSGWFIDLETLQKTNSFNYIVNKFKRLILPAISWQVVYILVVSKAIPDPFSAAWLYWYLSALFLCLCIIMFSAKFIKNVWLCITLSTICVIILPFSNFVDINFMFPYLWAGYLLRKLFDKEYAKYWVLLFSIVGVCLSIFWKIEYTVYITPFKSLYLNSFMIYAYLYRFTIGFCLSASIIYLVKLSENTKALRWMTEYGKYTLLIYAISPIMNSIFARLLETFDFHTNDYIMIDITALILSCMICVTSIFVYKAFCRNEYLSLFFLGEFIKTK